MAPHPSRWVMRAFASALLALTLVSVPATATAQLYAVLMSGYADAHFEVDLSYVYRMLLEAGYTKADIHVLFHDGEARDLDLDGVADDVDDSCYKTDIDEAFFTISNQVGPNDVIFFFATGHGSTVTESGNGWPTTGVYTHDGSEPLRDYELNGHLKALETSAGGDLKKICLIVPCYSGGFFSNFVIRDDWKEGADLDELDDISVSASCRYDQKAWFYSNPPTGYPMAQWWPAAVRGKAWDDTPVNADYNGDQFVSLAEAFRFAAAKVAADDNAKNDMPQHFSSNCVLDNFMTVTGATFLVSNLVINLTCCGPPAGGLWWLEQDCYGHGVGVTPVTTFPGPNRATGAGIEARATLANAGTAPSESGLLHYYYRAPTLGLGFYDSGWQSVATRSIPPLAPGQNLDMPPVTFAVPDLNPFGELYWSVAARIEDPANPPGSGWGTDDPQAKMVNVWRIEAVPGDPQTIHFEAVNPISEPARVVLGVDATGFPSQWQWQLAPAVAETLLFAAGETRVVTLVVQAVGGASERGTIHVYESLLPVENSSACDPSSDCRDHDCGGFIRLTGGCAVTLVATGPTATAVSLAGAEATPDRVRLTWLCTDPTVTSVAIERRTETSDWSTVGDACVERDRIAFEDRDVRGGARLGYRVAWGPPDERTAQGETWIDVPVRPELALVGVLPNPTRNDLVIVFALPDRSPATLELLDVAGRTVMRREVGTLGAGNHVLRLARGDAVHAGVYVVRLRQGSRIVTTKSTLLD